MADKYASVELRLNDYLSSGMAKAKNHTDDVTRSFDKQRTATSALSGAVKNLAVTFSLMIIGAKVLQFSKESIELYKTQTIAIAKLDSALGHSSKSLQEHAAAMQKNSTYGDEAVIEAQSLIAAFIKEEDQIKRVTEASMDMAAAKGMSLSNAADLLTKTIASSTNALSRYGIEVEGAVGSEDRLNSAMNAVNKAFGGRAQAIANTDVGKIEQTANLIGDIKETIGKELVPLQLQWSESVLFMVTHLKNGLSVLQKYASTLGSMAGGERQERRNVIYSIEIAATMEEEKAQEYLFAYRIKKQEEIKKQQEKINNIEQNGFRIKMEGNKQVAEKRMEYLAKEKRLLLDLQYDAVLLKKAHLAPFNTTGSTKDSPTGTTTTPGELTSKEAGGVGTFYVKAAEDSYNEAKTWFTMTEKVGQESSEASYLSAKQHYEAKVAIAQEYAEAHRALYMNTDQAEITSLREKQELELQMLGTTNDQKKMLEEAHIMQMDALKKAQAKREEQRLNEENAMKKAAASALINSTARSLNTMLGTEKKYSEGRKRIAQATAIVDTYTAAQMAYKNGQSIGGIPGIILGGVAMAAAIVSGLANVAQIQKQKFGGGGIYRGGGGIVPGPKNPPDSVNAQLTGGEMELNPRQQSNLFKMIDSGGSNSVPVTVNLYDNSGNLTETIASEIRNGSGQRLIDEILRRS